ncbi:hypothetical protein GT037_002255 [Alternaria burnsii]|uniref:BTB domain-containing protein n=1 Tax=Alternaria burnsii TaxID=1187904 RepID=A0A8H7BAV1_9PLEO|nr:uncharacterized protein GT037_002255 [Alternaria burnsii]KAF7680604.1 hypothetical protein GT037_002255 [Alternaria burnsii]
MNALDFLVDFATLVSTSEALRQGYDGNNVDHNIDPMHSKVDLASELGARPTEKSLPINGERPVNTAQLQSNMAPPLSQNIFSAYAVDRSSSNTHCHDPYEEFLAVPSNPHMSQSFDQFLHQHPVLGLSFMTADGMSYLACDCERFTQWGPNHQTGYSLPTKSVSWSHVQPYQQPPNHDIRFLETQFVPLAGETRVQSSQCMDAACHCQYTPPHQQAVSNDFSPYFESLLTRWEDCADLQADGSYYIDADADTFEHILNFMRRPSRLPLY